MKKVLSWFKARRCRGKTDMVIKSPGATATSLSTLGGPVSSSIPQNIPAWAQVSQNTNTYNTTIVPGALHPIPLGGWVTHTIPKEVNQEAFDLRSWTEVVGIFRDRGIEPFETEIAMILVYVRKYGRTVAQEVDDFFPFILQRRVIGGEK